MLVVVPLTLGYLGSERYGLWMTISSVSLMLAFADFGIGNGVLNVTADAYGSDNRKLGREAASSGFFLLSLIAVVLIAVFAVSYTFLPWPRIFNVTSADAVREAGPATAVFVLVWALNLPLDVVQRIQLGYQRGFINYAWQAAGSCLALIGAVAAIKTSAGLPWLVLALTGGRCWQWPSTEWLSLVGLNPGCGRHGLPCLGPRRDVSCIWVSGSL